MAVKIDRYEFSSQNERYLCDTKCFGKDTYSEYFFKCNDSRDMIDYFSLLFGTRSGHGMC